MKNLMKLLGVFVLYAVISLSACKSDDPKACENGAFKATINNELATGATFNNTLLKASGAKRMDIRATDAKGRQLIISLSDQSTGTTGDGVSTAPYIPFKNVATGTENTFFFTIIDAGTSYVFADGSLDITSCDAGAKKVSGTFSFTDPDYVVTNGSFTNMCYTVIQ